MHDITHQTPILLIEESKKMPETSTGRTDDFGFNHRSSFEQESKDYDQEKNSVVCTDQSRDNGNDDIPSYHG
jgi:hypothetical protein